MRRDASHSHHRACRWFADGRRFLVASSVATTLWVASTATLPADTIVLRDGREYKGALREANAAEVVFEQASGLVRYPRAEVVHVRLQQDRVWDEFTHVDQIDDAILRDCLAQPLEPSGPGAGTYLLHQTTRVDLRSAHTWRRRSRSVIRVLNEHGEAASIREMHYRKDAERVLILHAVSIRDDGSVVHLRDTAVQDESIYAGTPRYDTVARRRFALPEGKPGTVLDVLTEVERHTPLPGGWFTDEFLFGGIDPGRMVRYELHVPADGTTVRWQVLNNLDDAVTHEATPDGDGVRHVWERRALPQLVPEPMMPPLADLVPRLVVSTFPGTWEDAIAEFAQRLHATSAPPPALPDAIVAGTVDAVWEFVARNVKALPISMLATGHAPRAAEETWRLRQGAELDRIQLLEGWLRAVGLHPQWVWARPRTEGRLALDVPSLHALGSPGLFVDEPSPAYLFLGDDLSARAEPLAALSGAPSLRTAAGIAPLPSADPRQTGNDRTVVVHMDRHGNARVVDRITYRGGTARTLRAWRGQTAETIRNTVQGMASNIDARATRISHRVDDVGRNDQTMTLTIEYKIPEFGDARPTLCSLCPPWLDYDARIVGRTDRQFPMFWNEPRQDTVSVTVHEPPGFHIHAMPETARHDGTVATLNATASQDVASARFEVVYSRAALEAPVEAYAEVKTCLEQRAALGRQFWVWRKGGK